MSESGDSIDDIVMVWHSLEAEVWERALTRYWSFVQPTNLELERVMAVLDLSRIRQLDPQGWYDFLLKEYFPWKYTARNRLASTTRHLRQYADTGSLDELYRIKQNLLIVDQADTRKALRVASNIKGLGTAGASGLLALLYPGMFGTVDQFMVKALRQIESLPESAALARMNPEQLTIPNAVMLIKITRRKADENNHLFHTTFWTPRKIDMILWTYGRYHVTQLSREP